MQITQLTAGDSLSFTRTVADYPATLGYTLKYRFVPRTAGGTAQTVTATPLVADYVIFVGNTVTALWAAGEYAWAAWVEKTATNERYTLDNGVVTVLPDPAQIGAGTDTRTHARRMLALIETMLEGKATKDVQEYSIGGRQLKSYDPAALIVLHKRYVELVQREDAAARLNAGLPTGRTLQVRLLNAS
ncbi:MAG: hypothetical protein AB3X44_16265 [Leptothrix sp. (in: b-proteobacteria)]